MADDSNKGQVPFWDEWGKSSYAEDTVCQPADNRVSEREVAVCGGALASLEAASDNQSSFRPSKIQEV
jgi:hypothetical protein